VIGHEDKHDTAYCSGFEITDHEITVALKNELFDAYKEVLSDTQYEEPLPEDSEMLEYDREQNYEEQEHITNTWDERLVIHRGKDKLTIAEWKGIGLTKLVDAIERNTGNDSEAQNISPCWYNEAFDGITVIVCTTVLETGMVDPSERAAVLDVKLTPKNKGQKDLFSKAYSSQFKMKDTISTYNDKWQVGMFSNLGGSKNVYMEKMEDLYHSKKFYIPNVNTQDLK